MLKINKLGWQCHLWLWSQRLSKVLLQASAQTTHFFGTASPVCLSFLTVRTCFPVGSPTDFSCRVEEARILPYWESQHPGLTCPVSVTVRHLLILPKTHIARQREEERRRRGRICACRPVGGASAPLRSRGRLRAGSDPTLNRPLSRNRAGFLRIQPLRKGSNQHAF